MRQKHPPESKSKRYAIELSCVAWMDLLGYGAMLQQAQFNPNDKRAVLAIRRLKDFQQTVMQHAHAVFPAMPINDGVAYFADLTRRSTSKTADFLRRSIEAYQAVNEVEKAAGYPGARMVLALGPRARIGRPRRAPGHLENILARLNQGLITDVQAINEAFKAGPIAGFVPQLQANFAFTRA